MTATLRELADLVDGRLEGDEALAIHAARPMDSAGPTDITFVEKQHQNLAATHAAAVIVPLSFHGADRPVIRVDDPLFAFVTIFRHFQQYVQPPPHGIDDLAFVHPTAKIGPQAGIYPFAAVGEGTVIGERCEIHSHVSIGRNCRIGDDVTLFPGCVLYDDTIVGHRVRVHANAVLGADGFGYRPQQNGHLKVPQLGNVIIEDDVEIGAGVTIDCGTFHSTRIGGGTKIDNQVQIGHNCQIGRHNLLVSQVGIGGSSSTGDFVVLAGQVGVVDHVKIGTGAAVGAQGGVAWDIPAGQRVWGSPAISEHEMKRIVMLWQKLPEMRRDLKAMKNQLGMDGKEAA